MERKPGDDLEVNIEKTVVSALSKLQKRSKASKKKLNDTGVSCKKLAQFLRANYPWMDGDVESQVMTVLLSCIKTGLVCALHNEKYIVIKASPGTLVSNCLTRVYHGPKCCCLTTLKCLLGKVPQTCCAVKKSDGSVKRIKKFCKIKATVKPVKPVKPSQSSKQKKVTKDGKKREKICVQKAQRQIGTSLSAISLCNTKKCSYCLEIHSVPKLRKLCMKCYPIGPETVLPPDNFSPRDEGVLVAECNS